MEELAKAYGVDEKGFPKQTTYGMSFTMDPDLLNRAKQLGFNDVMEDALASGYDAEKAKQEFNKKASKIEKYEPPKRKPARQIEGGGKDFSGQGQDKFGGFGTPPEKI
jgi:hypothetical protein